MNKSNRSKPRRYFIYYMSTETITVSKIEYNRLKQQAMAYRKFTARFFDFLIKDSVKNVVDDFRQTNLYTEDFLNDLENGLSDSTYFQNYGNKAVKAKIKRVSRRTSSR